MIRTRVIPCLQLIEDSLVKTVRFKKYKYIGDPINTVRIFNELEVDELCLLDIRATVQKRSPNLKVLEEIANECFMPLSYGGGLRDFDTVKKIFTIGFEKVVVNSFAIEKPEFVTILSEHFGNQAIIGSIDLKKSLFGDYNIYINDGTKKVKLNPVEWAIKLEKLGAGELLITSIDKDGTWQGYDVEIINTISKEVKIPVIANGGAGKLQHIIDVLKNGKASAVAVGSMVVYQKKDMGVLINFPDKKYLNTILENIL